MMENFEINSKQIDKIKRITAEEKNFRIKNLEFFQSAGFPNKRLEDWKFSDFKNIVYGNFDSLDTNHALSQDIKIDLLKNFEHNYILLVNGNLQSSNFDHEEKDKIKWSHHLIWAAGILLSVFIGWNLYQDQLFNVSVLEKEVSDQNIVQNELMILKKQN